MQWSFSSIPAGFQEQTSTSDLPAQVYEKGILSTAWAEHELTENTI